MKRINGVVLYDGPSVMNGKPIVAIATFRTENDKIGNTVQIWYLPRDIHPVEALRTGEDSMVCGSCPLRGVGGKQRPCYVNILHGPTPIWNAFHRGSYPTYNRWHNRYFSGKMLRLGAYGEPVSVPITVQRPLMDIADGVIGYTHAWRAKRYHHWRHHLMASVHSLSERSEAQEMGWRTFRGRLPEQELGPGEFICPASPEAGYRLTCSQCGACGGGSPSKASPAIIVHGSPNKVLPIITAYTKQAA
jgi:hypothetical protein